MFHFWASSTHRLRRSDVITSGLSPSCPLVYGKWWLATVCQLLSHLIFSSFLLLGCCFAELLHSHLMTQAQETCRSVTLNGKRGWGLSLSHIAYRTISSRSSAFNRYGTKSTGWRNQDTFLSTERLIERVLFLNLTYLLFNWKIKANTLDWTSTCLMAVFLLTSKCK